MSNYTHQTAPTQFVEASGIRFAYRRFGKAFQREERLLGESTRNTYQVKE